MNAKPPSNVAFRFAAAAGQRGGAHRLRLRPLAQALGQAIAVLGASAWLAPAHALPNGAYNVAGQVNAAPVEAGRLVLTQTTPRAVVDWQGFSIAAGESVRLQQPDKGVALFNVVGRESSQIFGTLTASGTLFLTNPNGVLFGAGSSVEVGAMVASTLRLSADDFKLGRHRFAGDSTASVVNRGSIKTGSGGYAVLLGQSVDNSGLVSAPLGTVALGAASAATLDVYGNGLLTLQLNTAADAAIVKHTGTLRAPGGRIEVSALGTAARPAAINVGGLLQAQSLQERNGEIILSASGPGASLSFAAGASANADGGGSVRLLSDGATTFAGSISAREGGSAEVSGQVSVTVTGTADLRSADGRFGTFVIDPTNIVIRAGGVGDGTANTLTDGFLSALLSVANVTVLTSAGAQTAAPSISVLGDTRVAWAVASNLTLEASRDLAVQAGARIINTNAGATAFDALVLRANASGTAAGTSAGVSLGAGSQLLGLRGSIGVQGTGGTVGAGNVGVVLGAGAKLRSDAGNINVSGTGGGDGSGSNNAGVQLIDQSSVIAGGTGAVNISGVGGKSTDAAPGVQFGPGVGTLATNSGTLSIAGKGGSSASGQAQGIVSTGDANLQSVSGSIDLRGSAASTAADGIAFLSGSNRIDGGSGNISFTSDRISLLAGSTVKTTGTVLLQPLSSERPINIGAADTNASLGLAGAELNRITAGRIQVGNPKAGSINLSQSFSPSGTDTLSLVSALAVTESPLAAYTVPKLSIQAGSVNLPNANQVGTIAADALRGNFVFNEADALTVGAVAGHQGTALNGVRASGSVLITAPNGRLTLDQALSAGAAGDALTTASKSFTNNAGGVALTAANGRWRVFSSDPADDVRSTQAFDFKRYDCNFGGACTPGIPGAGNGFLYSIAPVLSLKLARTGGVYGEAPAIGLSSYELSGLIDSDTLTTAGLAGTALFTTTATATAHVGDYPVRYAGGLSTTIGYRVSQTVTPSSVYSVRVRPINVAADAQGRIYGNANPALSYTVGGLGLVNGDTLSGALATTASTTSNVGSYAITQGTLAASPNYALSFTGANLAIAARALSVAADAQSRVYGNANPALTYTVGGLGLVNGDTLSGGLATTASATSNVGSYAITQGTLAASPNYALSFTGANLAIAARALSVAADAQSRVYGNANPALSYTVGGLGLVNGDTLSGALATTASTTSNVGSYAITQGTLAASPNYVLSFTGANLAIAARALSVAADAQSRIYGNANPALTYTVGGLGLVNGDTLSGGLATTASATSNVGSYAITQGTLAASPNYALSFTGANLAIAARALSVAADAQSRIYGNANPALTYTVGGLGLVNGDTLSGALATTATTTSNVGSYAITQGTLAASPNYALNFTGANLAIAARTLSVAADAQSRIYGNANPALTYSVGGLGLVNGDTLSGGLATTASATSNIGSYAITQGTLAASPNYVLSFTGANLAIAARALSVAADAQSRIYGNANPALTYSVGGLGLVNGDTLSGALATTASTTSSVGSYAITQGTLAASPNYALSFTGANFAIAARSLSVAADAQSRIYGNANPALTYTVGGLGLVNGDTLGGGLATTASATSNVGSYAITQGTLAASPNYALSFTGANLAIAARSLSVAADAQSRIYGNANPALTYTVGGLGLVNGDTLSGGLATTASATSNVGSYAITQGTLAASPNYAIGFTAASLSVAARAVTLTPTSQTRVYGNGNPSVGGAVVTLGSLVNGDSVSSVSLSAPAALATTAAGSTAPLLASNAVFGSGLASNYSIAYASGSLLIGQRGMSVAAVPGQGKTVGTTDPALAFNVVGGSLVNGDGFSGSLVRTSGEAPGRYAIGLGTLSAGANYALSYTGADFLVGGIPGIGPVDRNPGQGTPVSNPLAAFLASLDTLAPTAAGPDGAGACIVEQPLGTAGDLVQRSTAAPVADNRLVNAGIRLPQGVVDPCRVLPERERKAPFISASAL